MRSPFDIAFAGRRSPFGGASNAEPYAYTKYLDTASGSDSNDGLTIDTPKATWASLSAGLTTNDVVRLAPGSVLREEVSTSQTGVEIICPSAGNRAVIDLRGTIAGPWTADPDYANVWYCDVTHAYDIVPAASLSAASAHFGIWDKRTGDQFGSTLRPYWGNVKTNTNGSGTIADYRSYVGSNPGTFTCHKQGSTNSDPRRDTGSNFRDVRYYIHLSDSGDPNTAGTTILHADGHQIRALIVPRGGGVRNVICIGAMWRTINDPGVSTRPRYMINVRSVDTPGHGAVVDADVISNFTANGYKPNSQVFTHAGLNTYRTTSANGTSPGCTVSNIDLTGYGRGFYWHGNDAQDVHEYVVGSNINCTDVWEAYYPGSVATTVTIDGGVVTDCATMIHANSDSTVRNVQYVTTSALLNQNGAANARAVRPTDATGPTIEDCSFEFANSGEKFIWINEVGGGTKGVTLRRITSSNGIGGNAASGIGTTYRDIDVTLDSCTLPDVQGGYAARPFAALVADNSTFGVNGLSAADLRGLGYDVDDTNTLI